MAREAQQIQNNFGNRGFQYLEVLIDNNAGNYNVTTNDLLNWESLGGMNTIPVLNGSGQEVWIQYERDFGIPTTVFLGPAMQVLSVDQNIGSPGSFMN